MVQGRTLVSWTTSRPMHGPGTRGSLGLARLSRRSLRRGRCTGAEVEHAAVYACIRRNNKDSAATPTGAAPVVTPCPCPCPCAPHPFTYEEGMHSPLPLVHLGWQGQSGPWTGSSRYRPHERRSRWSGRLHYLLLPCLPPTYCRRRTSCLPLPLHPHPYLHSCGRQR